MSYDPNTGLNKLYQLYHFFQIPFQLSNWKINVYLFPRRMCFCKLTSFYQQTCLQTAICTQINQKLLQNLRNEKEQKMRGEQSSS